MYSAAHVCALCYSGESSLLGQGEMMRYDPTPGFNPFKRQVPRSRQASSDVDEKPASRNLRSQRSTRNVSKWSGSARFVA